MGTLATTENDFAAICDCASNLGEGNIAACIAQGHNRDEEMGSKAGDDVGMSCRGGEGRDVEHERVCGVHTLAIWEMGVDGFFGWGHVGHGGSSHEKMTCRARAKDGPCLHGSHVDIDSFKECSWSKRIFWGGGRATFQ